MEGYSNEGSKVPELDRTLLTAVWDFDPQPRTLLGSKHR